MELSPAAAIGRRIRDLRSDRGLSLSGLARQANIGKGSLSEIESGRRNPTVETLYAICTPLEVPMSALLGSATASTSSGGMTSALLDVRSTPTGTAEIFRLDFAAAARHSSPAHLVGVTEHFTVLAGELTVSTATVTHTIAAGSSATISTDIPHQYQAAATRPTEAVLVILTPRADTA